MSASLNCVHLIGNLSRAPELRYSSDGTAFANVTLVTNEGWKDRTSGEWVERAEYHRLAFAGTLAETAAKHLDKGAQIYIRGKLKTRKYEAEGGDRYVTEVRVDELQMLGRAAGKADKRQHAGDDGAAQGGDETQGSSEAQPSPAAKAANPGKGRARARSNAAAAPKQDDAP